MQSVESNQTGTEGKSIGELRAKYFSWTLLLITCVIFAYNINLLGVLTKGL